MVRERVGTTRGALLGILGIEMVLTLAEMEAPVKE
jgi:hypothetical protein